MLFGRGKKNEGKNISGFGPHSPSLAEFQTLKLVACVGKDVYRGK